jgi:hypothetical protein
MVGWQEVAGEHWRAVAESDDVGSERELDVARESFSAVGATRLGHDA